MLIFLKILKYLGFFLETFSGNIAKRTLKGYTLIKFLEKNTVIGFR